MICPNCKFTFEPRESKTVQRLAAWHSGHEEPTPAQPETIYAPISFADPATSPGGVAHLLIGNEGIRPIGLTVVFVPAGSVQEADRTPEKLIGIADFPQFGFPLSPDVTFVDVAVPGVTPGNWDVGVIATYAD